MVGFIFLLLTLHLVELLYRNKNMVLLSKKILSRLRRAAEMLQYGGVVRAAVFTVRYDALINDLICYSEGRSVFVAHSA